jgi:hypothetical protein
MNEGLGPTLLKHVENIASFPYKIRVRSMKKNQKATMR